MSDFNLSDWVDLDAWKFQSRRLTAAIAFFLTHLFVLLAAMLTFYVAGRAAMAMVSSEWLPYFDDLEGFIFLGVVVFFGIWLLWELLRNAQGKGFFHAFMVA